MLEIHPHANMPQDKIARQKEVFKKTADMLDENTQDCQDGWISLGLSLLATVINETPHELRWQICAHLQSCLRDAVGAAIIADKHARSGGSSRN